MASVVGGRYELLGSSPIGAGQFGEVWLAHDHIQDEDVALKLLRPGKIPPHIRVMLVLNEARFLTELRGPNVLRVKNADTDAANDVPFIAMEIAELGSAEDALRRSPAGLTPETAVAWVSQALIGLGSCHTARVLHGDVKPGNMFLKRADTALLGDLGLAQRMNAAGQGQLVGDLAVASPEGVATGLIGTRSDIYATGVSLFRLLSGQWPFTEGTEPELRAAILRAQPSPLRDLAPHVPLGLVRVVEKAMSVDPAERHADAQEMREDLARRADFGRRWSPIAPHSNHRSCWQEEPTLGRAAHSVCVLAGASGHEIVVSRGAGGRVTQLCESSIPLRRLPARVRRAFHLLEA